MMFVLAVVAMELCLIGLGLVLGLLLELGPDDDAFSDECDCLDALERLWERS